VERLAMDKHSSLLRKLANYGGKKIYWISHSVNDEENKRFL
jgi:hypothetical protein